MGNIADIVLIDPFSDSEKEPSKLFGLIKGGGHLPHLGLCSIAAVLEKSGYRVKYIDAQVLELNIQECCDEAIKYRPRYIGITAVTMRISKAARVADRIKESYNCIIIIGGVHVSAVPVDTMQRFESFDIGVVGEGELTVVDLLKALDRREDLQNIDGIVYRKNGQIFLNRPRDYIKKLDTLPLPAWHMLPELSRYYQPNFMSTNRLPSNHIVTSRGCYGKCIFCDKNVTGRRIRAFSTDYVINMIDILHNKYKIRDIQINDDTFVSLKKRAHEICDILIEKKWDITWACDARVNDVDLKLLKKMKRSGCWQIAYGIETGSQEVLDFIKKDITIQQVEKAVKWTKEAGIQIKGFFIIGHPIDTRETIMKTIDLMLRLDIDDFGLTFFTPYPGSPFYEVASQYGEFINNWDISSGLWIGSFIPNGLTREELISFRKIAHRKFYLRPKIILTKLGHIKTPFDAMKFVSGVVSFTSRFLSSYMLPQRSTSKN